jgi:predicted TIM-barrel fold metal-dependent hydrolase
MDAVLLDCDTHFSDHEPRLWADLAGERTSPVLPELVAGDGGTRLRIGDRLFPKPHGRGQGNPKGLGHLIGEGHDDDRAEFMAANGIAAAVLMPGFVGLSLQAVAEEPVRTGLAADYNLLTARSCARSRVGLRWAVLLSAEDPEWSLGMVERYDSDPTLVAGVVRPTARTPDARLSDPAFTPVLRALTERRLPLFVHGGTGCYQWSPLADGYADYTMTHVFGHMGEQMVALADLLTRPDGLPDGFRAVMLESGTSWIPSFLDRLDSHVRRLSDADLTPSALFRQHFAVVPDPEEKYALWACEEIGASNVLFGSDYPHWDTVRADSWAKAFGEVCPPERLRENTGRFAPRLAR